MKHDPSTARKEYRFLAGIQAFVDFGEGPCACQAVDLHRHGVMVEGEFDVEDRPTALIRLKSTAGDLNLEARGHVAHISRNEDTGKARLGFQFDEIDNDQVAILEQLLARVIEGMDPAPLTQLDRDSSENDIKDALKKVPLAHKITYAHRALPLQRKFLVLDESPQVIEAICRNPQLTRPEVVEILRMPNILPTTLELLSRDGRWTGSEDLRITIATHPRVTFPVAERLVKTLSLVGIRKLIRKPGLNPAIKTKLVQSIPHKQLQGW